MSEQDDDLELQALQRRLDDAFATTRPRPGFEDDLWLRMQARRPLFSRIGAAFSGFVRGVPAVPAAAVAAVLVVVIGVGVIGFSGWLGGHPSTASSTSGAFALAPPPGPVRAAESFGILPSPSVNAVSKSALPASASQSAAGSDGAYAGSESLTWTGQFTLTITSAPVFRYQEPSTGAADQFASALGAVLQNRPAGFLGSYDATDYTIRVRGTVEVPPVAPAYFILSAPNMPSISAAGAGPADIATLFLAEHGLTPQWPYTVAVDPTANPLKVRFLRQFNAPGYGLASLVDPSGVPYGMEVDLNGNQAVLASGPLPVTLDSSSYPIISFDQAVRLALNSAPPATGSAPLSVVRLSHAELVYVLVPAGDHSFYEPAFLFSGTFQTTGVTYEERVLVPAIASAPHT